MHRTSSSACVTTTASAVPQKEAETQKDDVIHVVIRPKPHVVFDESVIDNEFAGRKSSKSISFIRSIIHSFIHYFIIFLNVVCCIYRKKRVFGEDSDSDSSSSSSSCSSCSSSDNENDANKSEEGKPEKHEHCHHHHHHHHKPRRNAYERQPHYKKTSN